MNRSNIIFCILLCILVSACSSNKSINDADSFESNSLFDVVWQVQEYTDINGSGAIVADETKYQFLFESGSNTMQAFIGCVNHSLATYIVSDGFLNFDLGPVNATSCINGTEPFLEQNMAIFNILFSDSESGNITAPLMFSFIDDRLKLQSPDGRMLTFIQVDNLMESKVLE